MPRDSTSDQPFFHHCAYCGVPLPGRFSPCPACHALPIDSFDTDDKPGERTARSRALSTSHAQLDPLPAAASLPADRASRRSAQTKMSPYELLDEATFEPGGRRRRHPLALTAAALATLGAVYIGFVLLDDDASVDTPVTVFGTVHPDKPGQVPAQSVARNAAPSVAAAPTPASIVAQAPRPVIVARQQPANVSAPVASSAPQVVATAPAGARSSSPVVASAPTVARSSPPAVAATPNVAPSSSPVVATAPTLARSSPAVVATTSTVAPSSSPVVATAPTVARSAPIVVATTPTVARAAPPVVASAPTVTRSSPPAVATTPTVARAAPPVVAAAPTVTRSSPPVVATTPTEARAAPPVVASALTVTRSAPPAVATTPTVARAAPPVVASALTVTRSAPPAVATTPTVARAAPPVVASAPTVAHSSPPAVATAPVPARPSTSVVATTPAVVPSSPLVVTTAPTAAPTTKSGAGVAAPTPRGTVVASVNSNPSSNTDTMAAPLTLADKQRADAERNLKAARGYLQRGNLSATKARLAAAITAQPNNRDARGMRAQVSTLEQQRDALLSLARGCSNVGRWECASHNANEALRIDSSSKDAQRLVSLASHESAWQTIPPSAWQTVEPPAEESHALRDLLRHH
ncbi:hypothetical protein OKW49_005717 [Paraburkholderia youngii]